MSKRNVFKHTVFNNADFNYPVFAWNAIWYFGYVIAMLGSLTGSLLGQESASRIQSLKTIAESSNYQATATEAQVLSFLKAIDEFSPHANLTSIGETTEGRPLLTLILSKEASNPLPLPANDPRLVVLVLGGIHSGECDSKEAVLAMARDWVTRADLMDKLEKAVFVILPNFNADGNERVGTLHRPGQEGPILGMGTRENAAGLDLNRDFIKLDSPEVRSLVRAFDAWDVDVLFDCHTTNGSLHQYDLTYDIPHNPAANQKIVTWLRKELFPVVGEELKQAGLPIFYYGNFSADHQRWESFGHEPRYSTEYMGLRGKIGILVESYSYAGYQRRIDATQMFVESCVKQLLKDSSKIQNWMKDNATPTKAFPIQAKILADSGMYKVGGYRWIEDANATPDASRRSKFPTPRDRKRKSEMVEQEFDLQLWNVGSPVLQVDAPKYYFIPYDAAWVASRLRLHGIQMLEQELKSPLSAVTASRYRIVSTKDQPDFQAHKPKKFEVAEETFEWVPQSGWLVPTQQPLGALATYLLEPHADDSLAFWNFFDPSLQAESDYPVIRLASLPSGASSRTLPALQLLDRKPGDIAKEPLTLEKLYSKDRVSFSGMAAPFPKWLTDKAQYIAQHDNRIVTVDCQTGAMQPFDRPGKLADALAKLQAFSERAASYRNSLSAFDATFENALIEHKGDLYLYRSSQDSVRQLTHDAKQTKQVPALSPTGSHVAFVHENNIWVVDCESTETRQLTKDGGGEILNGYLDWVYQEEVYGRGQFKSYWWSPDGKHIAYLRLDETPVPTFVVDNSLPFAQSIEKMRYPKSGQPNPLVTLHVLEIASGSQTEIPLSDYAPDDRLVVRVGWSSVHPTHVVYQVQNRIQSILDVWAYDVATKQQKKLLEERSPAWVDVIDEPRWLPDGSFLWMSDSVGGRRHLYHYDPNGRRTALTEGAWDVKEVSWVAKDGGQVIVLAHRSAPTNTDVLAIDIKNRTISALGSESGSHRISVHPSGEYLFDAWSDMSHPSQPWLCDKVGKPIRYVGGPKSDRFDYVKTQTPELFTIAARDGFEMQSILYKPTEFEQRKKQAKIPVLIHVYGGPQAPTVENSWTHRSDLWHRFMAEQGVAVLLCDNRSALGKGNSDTWKIYRDMGSTELRDLEDAVGWLKEQDWVDGDRIGMWGWSYGGYFTAYAMTHSKLFRAGIAGAPVTDWNNYDSIYTERYMSTPQLNPEGYKTSSAVAAAKNLSGRLMIIHGEIDDNVHMANSMQLVHALQKAGKQFDLMVYPNNRHGITDPEQSAHQYRLMTYFFLRELRP
jgi:dipeptidyl aminopeptidase/acylaminoacyl peptidase